ncbi:MAG: hypothetical protein WAP55_02540 [Minisyncoccia bacterium]
MAKKERGNGKMGLGGKAERMLRRSQATGVGVTQPKRLDRNETGRFLVAALADELNPDLGIFVPKFPVSAGLVLMNMDGPVEAPDPVWKGRSMTYLVPHPGIVFTGVVEAKNVAHAEAIAIVESGWANGVNNGLAAARAKVRAGQIIIDYLHFLEGKNRVEFQLNSGFVAGDIVTDRCLSVAEESGVALKFINVRQSAQFGHEELMESLGGVITIQTFGGALEYTYRLPHPKAVATAVRGLVIAVEGRGTDQKAVQHFSRMPEDERRLFIFSACDVLDDLLEMEVPEAAEATRVSGNGHDTGDEAIETEAATEEVAETV